MKHVSLRSLFVRIAVALLVFGALPVRATVLLQKVSTDPWPAS